MTDNETTHIRVAETDVDRLYHLKRRKESYGDVVTRLLDDADVPPADQLEKRQEA